MANSILQTLDASLVYAKSLVRLVTHYRPSNCSLQDEGDLTSPGSDQEVIPLLEIRPGTEAELLIHEIRFVFLESNPSSCALERVKRTRH